MKLPVLRNKDELLRWAQDTVGHLNSFFKGLNSVDELRLKSGSIVYWSGTQIPNGWVPCDGRKLDQKSYHALASELSSRNDDGTFNVPSVPSIGSIIAIIKT
jgi:hypothetical protein